VISSENVRERFVDVVVKFWVCVVKSYVKNIFFFSYCCQWKSKRERQFTLPLLIGEFHVEKRSFTVSIDQERKPMPSREISPRTRKERH